MNRPHRLLSAFGASLGGRDFGPIGLELGAESLQLVQLERRAGALRIAAARSVPVPAAAAGAAEELEPLLRKALRGRAFRGRRVVTLLPDAGARLMVMNYALEEAESEPQRILRLVEERSDEPIAECVVDYLSIRTADENARDRSALVAVARRDAVIDYLELLRRSGFSVEALEIAPVAIHRLAAWLAREEHSSHSVVLYGGQRRSHLTVFAGRRLLLYRELEFGEDAAVEAIAKALDMGAPEAAAMLHRYGVWPDEEGRDAVPDPAEATEVSETLRQILKPGAYGLAEEIKRAGVYTSSQWRGASLGRVWLLGAFARWPRVERLLESLVSVPTSILDPTRAFTREGDTRAPWREAQTHRGEAQTPGGDIALAAGLALRGLVDG